MMRLIKLFSVLAVILSVGMAGAVTVFETDGSSLKGWETQWHEADSAQDFSPVWASDGERIKGAPFHSKHRGEDLGGTMFHSNSFSMAVGDVATFTMEFEGKGISIADDLNHWWFSFGLRTGGTDPWQHGDLAAYATFRTGRGPNLPTGFTLWNSWTDAWTEPYPRCDIASDENYESGPVSITFIVERTDSGFGPSVIIASNHVNGVESIAVGTMDQMNQNQCVSSNLYFFLRIPSAFDEVGELSTMGTHVYVNKMKLTVGEDAPRPSSFVSDVASGGTPTEAVAPTIRRIVDMKRLSNVDAAKQFRTVFKAQVLNLHPKQNRLFVHDGQAGIYIELDKPAAEYEGLRVGSEISVDAVTQSGGYSPILFVTALEVLGQKPLPEAVRMNRTLNRSTNFDVDWVEVRGRPFSMELIKSYGHYLISMEVFHDTEVEDEILEVFIPFGEEAFTKMKPFMFRPVQISGVIATTANKQKQMTGRVLYANSADDFRLLSEFAGTVPRYYPMHELMQYGIESYGLVKTRGTITRATKDTVYLRGDKGSLKASIFQEQLLAPGDIVELTGYVHIQPVSPAFRTVSVHILERGEVPLPVHIELNGGSIDSDWNSELVKLEAEFVYGEKTFTKQWGSLSVENQQGLIQQTLWCRAGSRLIEARLPSGEPLPMKLRPGSLLRLTGICHVSETKNPRLDQMTDTLWLELPDDSSITILRQASWWTPQRLVWSLMSVLILCMLFILWIFVLRRTVTSQTQTIGQQIVRETMLNERQRIARELHDTLEQGLTALTMQLNRVYRKIKNDPESSLQAVEQAENILRVCRDESRASIQDLRGGLLEEMDLPAAVEKTIISRLDDTTVGFRPELKLSMSGVPVRLTLFAEHQLLRTITEAASNAVQHASPETISIQLDYGEEELHVVVQDDGCGFDPEHADEAGHFGVRGMYERVNRIGGKLEIESSEQSGTRVLVNVPVTDLLKEGQL